MKKLKIKFTPEAARLLSKLHPENKKLIKAALKELQLNSHFGTYLQEELAGFKSHRLKRYRIVYKINEEESCIEIYYIGHRSDVYEQFRILLDKISQTSPP